MYSDFKFFQKYNCAIIISHIITNKIKPYAIIYRSKWQKDASRKLAWELYSQGMGQREIATRCDHKQGWVSKLLEEKTLSESIAQEASLSLVRRSGFQEIRKDPQGLDRMIEQLRNHLVSSEQEGDISPLRQMVKTALN